MTESNSNKLVENLGRILIHQGSLTNPGERQSQYQSSKSEELNRRISVLFLYYPLSPRTMTLSNVRLLVAIGVEDSVDLGDGFAELVWGFARVVLLFSIWKESDGTRTWKIVKERQSIDLLLFSLFALNLMNPVYFFFFSFLFL